MHDNFDKEVGLTLIEIMIVLAVLGIVSMAIYNVHLTGWKTWDFNQKRSNLQQSGRIAMLKMVKKIEKAIEVKDEDDGISWPVNKLVIKEKTGSDIEYRKYLVIDNKLYVQTVSKSKVSSAWPTNAEWKSKQPITTEIVKFVEFDEPVDNDPTNLIKIDLVLEKEKQSYRLTNQVYLKNTQ